MSKPAEARYTSITEQSKTLIKHDSPLCLAGPLLLLDLVPVCARVEGFGSMSKEATGNRTPAPREPRRVCLCLCRSSRISERGAPFVPAFVLGLLCPFDPHTA